MRLRPVEFTVNSCFTVCSLTKTLKFSALILNVVKVYLLLCGLIFKPIKRDVGTLRNGKHSNSLVGMVGAYSCTPLERVDLQETGYTLKNTLDFLRQHLLFSSNEFYNYERNAINGNGT